MWLRSSSLLSSFYRHRHRLAEDDYPGVVTATVPFSLALWVTPDPGTGKCQLVASHDVDHRTCPAFWTHCVVRKITVAAVEGCHERNPVVGLANDGLRKVAAHNYLRRSTAVARRGQQVFFGGIATHSDGDDCRQLIDFWNLGIRK